MKNKALIIGGVAIVALGAFFWMRKRSEMASEDAKMEDGQSETETGATTTGKGDTKPTPNSPIPRTDGASVKGSGSTITQATLTSKPINGIQDLDGTPLGLDISSSLVNRDARLKIQDAIVNMTSGERQVLNYIAVVDYTTRTSPSFKNALASKLGSNASSLVDSVYSKVSTASKFVPIATNQGTLGQRRDCRKEAYSRFKWYEQGKIIDFVNQCKREGGFDSGFDGSYSFNVSGFDTDNEDFAFNGHTF